jgi:stage II sporulation protein D
VLQGVAVCTLLAPAAAAADVRIGVFGLFHPQVLSIQPADRGSIIVRAGSETCILRPGEAARVSLAAPGMRVACNQRILEASIVHVTSDIGGVAEIELSVPGRIVRAFRGRVDVQSDAGELQTVVAMPLETAVASVVAAELPDASEPEALKALAIVARSYFVASRSGHRGFDFCDTTHCQYLRQPPRADRPAARAAAVTAGLVLAFRDRPIAAFHSASCGGHTRSLAEAGLVPADSYPYFRVECAWCVRHPVAWQRRLALDEDVRHLAATRSEAARIAVVRGRGWSAVPSPAFEAEQSADALLLHGRGRGHGIGLCQTGAVAMARDEGANCRQIVARYFPETSLKHAAE